MQPSLESTPSATPRASAPQLRTLLFIEVADSTGLIERLGDGPAGELFRAHDRLVLQLQQAWRGRLIDRSDGMLLLFERPIDGLGFALDYMRGLVALGEERRLELRARAGLHVGEVLTWRNSDEAVSLGAKPLEVEGLAKPMAARLMTLARPGQILLTAVAEPLARRAARELGERGPHLLWKSWGRWRFKGVPDPQQIFEVGEPGIAPLRAPPSTPKAWRDVPLWRRPAMLLAEAAVLALVAVGAWFLTRPQPAIAFHQRDWVVIGELRNLTGRAALDDSLQQAIRISLEQSRHVNVLGELRVRETLARMRRAPGTVLDRDIASEIAVREGARAVLLPAVSEVGGRVRVSVEVVDPRTRATVHSASADGDGVGSVLESIDAVTAQLRDRFGEAMGSLERDRVPLPQATTANLDALRAYALGQDAYGDGELEQALRYYRIATRLDPGFALAWLGQMRAHYARPDAPAALPALRRAQALRDRLPPREALYLDAWVSRFDAPADTTRRWVELARLYPDFGPALSNAAMWLAKDNRFADALAFAQAAARAHPVDAGIDHDSIGRAQMALGRFALAAAAFDRASDTGSPRRRAAVEAARRDFAAVARLERRLPVDSPHTYIERTTFALDQGRWTEAQALARKGLALAPPGSYDARMLQLPMAVAEWKAGDPASARRHAASAAAQALGELSAGAGADAEDDAVLALSAALVLQRLGEHRIAGQALALIAAQPRLRGLPAVDELAVVVRAEQKRHAGGPLAAISLLEPEIDGNEHFQTRVALMRAYAAAGRRDAARVQARWLQEHRGLAYAELDCGHCRQALNIVDGNAATREASLPRRTRGAVHPGMEAHRREPER